MQGHRPCSDVERAFIAIHMSHVSISKFFAILIAMAMLFAPFAMRNGGAMAAAPSVHHSQMMDKGHCEQPATDEDSMSPDKSCCAAMCAAIAVAPVSPADPVAFARSVDHPSLEQFRHSFLAKLPTPPPRVA